MKFIICLNSKTKSYNHVKRHRKGHWQNQTSFAMKAMEGMGMEGTYLSIIKGIFGGKKQRNFKWRKNSNIPPKVKNRTRVSTLYKPFQYSA